MTDTEREQILSMLNYKDENGDERKSNDSWISIFLALFSMLNSQAPNVALEKEVAYLSGKVDTLEKILISKEV